MSYCQVHGNYGDYYDGCPECRAAEERAEADRKETKEELSRIAHKHANPGDFKCPHCKFISLKIDASRCPLCHGDIGKDYWQTLRANWKAEAKRLLVSGDCNGAFRIVSWATREYPLSQESMDLMDSWRFTESEMQERRRRSEEAKCVFCGVNGLPKGADTHQCDKCGRWFCYHCEDKSRGDTNAVFRVTRCKEHPPSKGRGFFSFFSK